MSPSPNLSDLKTRHDEAWRNLKYYIYEKYEPRFYRHKVGRKLELINPWKDLDERNKAEAHIRELWLAWDKLRAEYWTLSGGDRLEIPSIYVEKETPDGLRWVKENV